MIENLLMLQLAVQLNKNLLYAANQYQIYITTCLSYLVQTYCKRHINNDIHQVTSLINILCLKAQILLHF